MHVAPVAGAHLHYRFDGDRAAPVVVLSNSLGTTLDMWEPQAAVLAERHCVLRYDTRGHGLSLVSPGPYSIEQLGHDLLALLDGLGIRKASFCGLSMGGLIGQWLGIHAGERLDKLVLCNTAAKIGSDEVWNSRIAIVQEGGSQAMRELRDASIVRWFTPAFVEAQPAQVQRITEMLAATSPEGYAANCAAVRDADFREEIGRIATPTLIVVGSEDPVTTPEHGRSLQERIPGAELVEFHAAHLSNVEAGDLFTKRVLAFLSK